MARKGPATSVATHSQYTASVSSETAASEIAYTMNSCSIDLLDAAENSRKLRVRIHLLRDEIDELNESLRAEQERGEEIEMDAESLRQRAEDDGDNLEHVTNELRLKTRELDTMKAELSSLQTVSSKSTKLLTEKLALARELDQVMPELEHLRSQSSSSSTLLAEKLQLQRQLTTTQTELDNSNRIVKRLQSERSAVDAKDGDVAQLRADLAKSQRELANALRRADKVDEDESEQLTEARANLAREKRDRERAEAAISKAVAKAEADASARNAVLEEKLDSFRTKLRSTKERLKEAEAELEQARAAGTKPPPANPRKRTATQADPDAAIGTPGDAPAGKRAKRASSVLGEKSTFSITPFLARTTSVAPGDAGADEIIASIEDMASPSERPAKAQQPSSVLAPASAGKSNPKVTTGRKPSKAALAAVAEEADDAGTAVSPHAQDENTAPQANDMTSKPETATAAAAAKAPRAKPVLKQRKSLATFAAFRAPSVAPSDTGLPPTARRKRKLLGGGGPRTLFDEDEDDADAAPAAGARLGAQRAFGAFGAGQRALGGLGAGLLGARSKAPVMAAADGFVFSPLKKDRRKMAAAGGEGVP